MDIDLVLALFAGATLLLSVFSTVLQRASLPSPLTALAFGVLIGPYVLDVLRIEAFGVPQGLLLEQAARITLAIGLTGVALRLPHGYWRDSLRWVTVIIGLGMALMLVTATGLVWGLLGVPLSLALLLGAIITPTDPVVATPIVTGSMAKQRVPQGVRHDLSAESGLNDGLGYLFVMLPILLLVRPETAGRELLTRVLVWEVLGAAVFGAIAGYLLGKLFVLAQNRALMEESSYLGFVVPLGLCVLGLGRLLQTDAVLAVFVAAAVFGQIIPERDEQQEGKIDDAVGRFFLLPVFMLLGMALPFDAWSRLGWTVPLALAAAVFVRRWVALWAVRPLLRSVHHPPEAIFLGWFGPVGVSALFYATLAERLTGNREVFVYTTLAITISVAIHGLTTAPVSTWLARHTAKPSRQKHTAA